MHCFHCPSPYGPGSPAHDAVRPGMEVPLALGFLERFAAFAGIAGLLTACSADAPVSAPEDGEFTGAGASSLSLGGNPLLGALLFFGEFPGTDGNGRTCATCHVAGDAFQLTPQHVEARWQTLQAKRRHHPKADDPLFRSIDADDFADNFTLLRGHALVRVVLPLPRDAEGNKLIWPVDDPDAETVDVFRATPTVRNVALTAPFQHDGRFATLEDQANGALHAHAEIRRDPFLRFLRDVSAFERVQFSSPYVARLAVALDRGLPSPDAPLELDELETHGKALFDRVCGTCHGGPRLNEPVPELAGITAIRDVFVSKPLPPFAAGLPFAPSPVEHLARAWAVRVPGQEPVIRESTDPGIALQTGNLEDFNTFDIPTLFGVSKTAPYFRDNSAATLEDVVRHYQMVNAALLRIIPERVPFPLRPDPIEDADVGAIVAYLKRL